MERRESTLWTFLCNDKKTESERACRCLSAIGSHLEKLMKKEGIVVLDLGGQYAHLITAKLRGVQVFADLKDSETPIEELEGYKGLILSGSPSLASQGEGADYDPRLFEMNIPILGLCFGHQEIAKHYGGEVKHTGREYGPATLHKRGETPLFDKLGPQEKVWMSHMDSVSKLPPQFVELGYTVSIGGQVHRNSAIGSRELGRYGVQFHPEVDDTVHGLDMLEAFAKTICGCKKSWTMDRYADLVTEEIRKKTKNHSVLLLASGGVDSTVCAWLLSRAIGPDELHLLHIDNGLMRKEESLEVVRWFKENDVSRHVHFVDASSVFIDALQGVTEPEQKRCLIGEAFIKVLEEEARKLDLKQFVMAQGTIYPDTIETGGTRRAAVIKTHHNRVPVVEEMINAGKMIEPLADLYKTEVRELGQTLGIDGRALERHPFPGPGLGVRLLASSGDVPETHTEELEEKVARLARKGGFWGRVLPVRSVGVKADLRCYEQPVILWSEGFEWEKACSLIVDMVNNVEGINRGVLLWGKNPEGLSFSPHRAEMTRERLDILRDADSKVHKVLSEDGVMDQIWQCPVVLAPVGEKGGGKELLIVRPVYSLRAMTARPASISGDAMKKIRSETAHLTEIWGVALDITPKPPATIEWE